MATVCHWIFFPSTIQVVPDTRSFFICFGLILFKLCVEAGIIIFKMSGK